MLINIRIAADVVPTDEFDLIVELLLVDSELIELLPPPPQEDKARDKTIVKKKIDNFIIKSSGTHQSLWNFLLEAKRYYHC